MVSKVSLALETVLNVAKTVGTSGKLKAPQELVEFRGEVCSMCPHLSNDQCSVCGCFMNLKSQLLAATCPNGHWDQKLMEKALFGEIDDEIIDVNCCGMV